MTTPQEIKISRIRQCNEVVDVIAAHGRRFFYYSKRNRTGHFILDEAGRLRFVDEYTDKAILIVKGGYWSGFNNGGTLRRIVEDMADYIREGERVHRVHMGPWRHCGGGDCDMWGYGLEAMKKTRDEAFCIDIWKEVTNG